MTIEVPDTADEIEVQVTVPTVPPIASPSTVQPPPNTPRDDEPPSTVQPPPNTPRDDEPPTTVQPPPNTPRDDEPPTTVQPPIDEQPTTNEPIWQVLIKEVSNTEVDIVVYRAGELFLAENLLVFEGNTEEVRKRVNIYLSETDRRIWCVTGELDVIDKPLWVVVIRKIDDKMGGIKVTVTVHSFGEGSRIDITFEKEVVRAYSFIVTRCEAIQRIKDVLDRNDLMYSGDLEALFTE